MKHHLAVVIVLLSFALGWSSLAWADTTWVAAGNISGTWARTGSPYMIHAGDVTVSSTLTINPGVTIYFTGPYRFVVTGTLSATGALGDSLRFTTDPLLNHNLWRGVRFLRASANSAMRYCVVENSLVTHEGDSHSGGGVECDSCSPHFSSCTFRNNTSWNDGGAVYCREGARATFDSCEFYGNHTQLGNGAAIMVRNCDAVLNFCTLRDNYSGVNGGGAAFDHSAESSMLACTLRNNRAEDGGGVYSFASGLNCERCLLDTNSAIRGGGLFDTLSHSTLTNCILTDNWAVYGAGALHITRSSTTLLDYCTLNGNFGVQGSVITIKNSAPVIRNSIITNSSYGQGIIFTYSSSARLMNCDIYGHAGGNFSGTIPTGLGTISRLNFDSTACDAYGNIYLDPLFVDAANGDLRLSPQSPCISAVRGMTSRTDFGGQARPAPNLTAPDIGALESAASGNFGYLGGSVEGTAGPGIVYSDSTARIDNGHTLTMLPGTRVLFVERIGIVVQGRLLAEGTASDSITFSPWQNWPLVAWDGLQFLGASGTDETSRLCYCSIERIYGSAITIEDRPDNDPTFSHCLIRGNRNGTHSTIYSSGGSGARFESCRISGNSPLNNTSGGSCDIWDHPTFVNCEFDSNSSSVSGGAVRVAGGSPTFTGCSFYENHATTGGAVSIISGTARFSSCEIFANRADGSGGGLRNSSTSLPTIIDSCSIHDNTANSGAGITCDSSSVLTHCLIYDNRATGFGGGVNASTGRGCPRIENCTIIGNSSPAGAGLYVEFAAPGMRSSIVAFSQGSGIYLISANRPQSDLSYCDFYGNSHGDFVFLGNDSTEGPPGLGVIQTFNLRGDSCDHYSNIFFDPQFVDTAAHDFHLQGTSKCINAADPTLARDADGSIADIGAFQGYWPPHSPEPFDLLRPANNFVLTSHTVTLLWHMARDPDPGDSSEYRVLLFGPHLEVAYPTGKDTSLTLNVDSLGLVQDTTDILWYVEALGVNPDTTTVSITSRHVIVIHPLGATADENSLPRDFALHECYPNPFNPSTTIAFDLPRASTARLAVYDVNGRIVKTLTNGSLPAGRHQVTFDGEGLPSGVYFARMEAGHFVKTQKMVLLK